MIFKRIFKTVLRVVLGFITFVLLYALLGWALSHISVAKKPSSYPANVAIFILTNGVHTDVVLPIKSKTIDWSTMVKFENTIGKDTTA